LVLDYSGSMEDLNLLGDPQNRTTYDVLKDEVNKLLAKNYNIKLGLVIWADKIYDKVQVALNNTQKVKTDVNKRWDCPFYEHGATCRTSSNLALQTAHDMFGPWDGGEERYVLFISDGAPFDNHHSQQDLINMSEAEANRLFTESHANIITLQLVNSADPGHKLENFMKTISGSPHHHPDTCSYFNANSQASLDNVLTAVGNAIAC